MLTDTSGAVICFKQVAGNLYKVAITFFDCHMQVKHAFREGHSYLIIFTQAHIRRLQLNIYLLYHT